MHAAVGIGVFHSERVGDGFKDAVAAHGGAADGLDIQRLCVDDLADHGVLCTIHILRILAGTFDGNRRDLALFDLDGHFNAAVASLTGAAVGTVLKVAEIKAYAAFSRSVGIPVGGGVAVVVAAVVPSLFVSTVLAVVGLKPC